MDYIFYPLPIVYVIVGAIYAITYEYKDKRGIEIVMLALACTILWPFFVIARALERVR